MTTERIDPASWERFLESFALQHRGWLITVESAAEGARDVVFRALPLLDVAPDGEDGILVTAGEEPDGLRQYWTPRVTDLFVECAEGGAIERLRIVSPASETTIAFRAAVRPELVDGVA